ncbi:hypothetical protein HDU96_004272 [Phlyctochytrium bullatum]|nr:hypothetical protein HDU96_004272 [Phlyctochytrium bullatum]
MHILSFVAFFLAATAAANPVTLERRDKEFTVKKFTNLPEDLKGAKFVEGSNRIRGKDAGVTQINDQGVRLRLKKGGGGTAAVAPRELKPGEVACERVNFPQGNRDYQGVAMTFYSIESDKESSQNGRQDEIDFEYFGQYERLQINYFTKGTGGNEQILEGRGKKVNDLCIVNTGSELRWYVDGKLSSRKDGKNAKLNSKQWVWFTIWETEKVGSQCCGHAVSDSWTMEVLQFSIFQLKGTLPKPSNAPRPSRKFPAANNCKATVACDSSLSKFGLNTAASDVKVKMIAGSKTFEPCKNAPANTYIEFCMPKLQKGDKVVAVTGTGSNKKETELKWATENPKGNYYGFRL